MSGRQRWQRVEIGAALVVLIGMIAVVGLVHQPLHLRGDAIGEDSDQPIVTDLVLDEDEDIPPASEYIYADPSQARANGVPILVAWANHGALRRIHRLQRRGVKPTVVIVPGFVPPSAEEPVQLHWVARQRLRLALSTLKDRDGHIFLLSGGNVHPEGTPFNEAWEMRRFLIEELGVSSDRILIEPYARHSTTNLRNAGRLLLAAGIEEAVVVTTAGQGMYFGRSGVSGFRSRSLRELGYEIGALTAQNASYTQVHFAPSAAVWQPGDDPLDP
ncbi:MAG: YdcF family protein [Alphaproteobacteria bacterium]|nr:YdcF family protein [Alphaproteobacteria bacterium]